MPKNAYVWWEIVVWGCHLWTLLLGLWSSLHLCSFRRYFPAENIFFIFSDLPLSCVTLSFSIFLFLLFFSSFLPPPSCISTSSHHTLNLPVTLMIRLHKHMLTPGLYVISSKPLASFVSRYSFFCLPYVIRHKMWAFYLLHWVLQRQWSRKTEAAVIIIAKKGRVLVLSGVPSSRQMQKERWAQILSFFFHDFNRNISFFVALVP